MKLVKRSSILAALFMLPFAVANAQECEQLLDDFEYSFSAAVGCAGAPVDAKGPSGDTCGEERQRAAARLVEAKQKKCAWADIYRASSNGTIEMK